MQMANGNAVTANITKSEGQDAKTRKCLSMYDRNVAPRRTSAGGRCSTTLSVVMMRTFLQRSQLVGKGLGYPAAFMVASTPAFLLAMTFATGSFVVIRSERPVEIGG